MRTSAHPEPKGARAECRGHGPHPSPESPPPPPPPHTPCSQVTHTSHNTHEPPSRRPIART
eukprot:6477939-Prymnesium_polylepis.2